MEVIAVPIRKRIIHLYESGQKTHEIAEALGYCKAAVRRIRQHWRERGTLQPRTHLRGRKSGLTPPMAERLREQVQLRPDATLEELAEALGASGSTVDRWLRKLDISFKKATHAAEQDRPDVKEARDAWKRDQARCPAGRMIFLDEAGATTNMARRSGRAPMGQRVVCAVPAGHWKTVSMIGAIGVGGLIASMAVQSAVDGEAFKVYVREILARQLRAGDVVVMDNLSSHKVAGVREMIEQTGARLMYLPPYSPDLNPIENIWSKIKQKLRSIGARTFEALLDAISTALASVTPEDCQGSIRHCGYTLHNSG